MSLVLALDVETSDLPPAGMDVLHPQYPWPVDIGAVLFDMDGHDQAEFSSRIRSDGRSIAPRATEVHGITTRRASREGVSELLAIGIIFGWPDHPGFADQARYIVGYNLDFDLGILESSLIRLKRDPAKLIRRPHLQQVDLMKPSAQFCQIEGNGDSGEYRWPKMDQAMEIIRKERPRTGAHRGIIDARRAKRLFLSLHNHRALNIAVAA